MEWGSTPAAAGVKRRREMVAAPSPFLSTVAGGEAGQVMPGDEGLEIYPEYRAAKRMMVGLHIAGGPPVFSDSVPLPFLSASANGAPHPAIQTMPPSIDTGISATAVSGGNVLSSPTFVSSSYRSSPAFAAPLSSPMPSPSKRAVAGVGFTPSQPSTASAAAYTGVKHRRAEDIYQDFPRKARRMETDDATGDDVYLEEPPSRQDSIQYNDDDVEIEDVLSPPSENGWRVHVVPEASEVLRAATHPRQFVTGLGGKILPSGRGKQYGPDPRFPLYVAPSPLPANAEQLALVPYTPPLSEVLTSSGYASDEDVDMQNVHAPPPFPQHVHWSSMVD
jgi:hypothetical protein